MIPSLIGVAGRRCRAPPSVGTVRQAARSLTVTSALDHGPGSLRDAVGAARNGDTIVFSPELAGQTIVLSSGELVVKNSIAVEGPGAGQLSVSGDDNSR